MNKVILIGNLTNNPELNTSDSDVKVAKFNVAVNDYSGNASFFRVIAWRKTAENIFKFCHKGDKIAVYGYLQQNQYTSKDGTKRSTIDIIANDIEMLKLNQNTAQNADNDTSNNISNNIHEMAKQIRQTYRAAQESRLATEAAYTEEEDTLPF